MYLNGTKKIIVTSKIIFLGTHYRTHFRLVVMLAFESTINKSVTILINIFWLCIQNVNPH